MSEFMQYAIANPTLAFMLMLVLGLTLGYSAMHYGTQIIFGVFIRLPNRMIRHMNIRKHGWPPPHCDADGDFKEDKQ